MQVKAEKVTVGRRVSAEYEQSKHCKRGSG